MKTPLGLFGFVRAVVVVSGLASALPVEADSYVVDRLTDAAPYSGGEGSGLVGDLRYAITNAQGGDSITFSVTGTLFLTSFLPDLSRNVNIQGPGANQLTVHTAGSGLAVDSGTTVILSGLTVTGGARSGGGVFNLGTLTLSYVTISGNVAPRGGIGGGIWNYANATLTLNNSTVSGNSAIRDVYNPGIGGGIYNFGTLTLDNSTVSGNDADDGAGIANSGTLALSSSTVSGNSSELGLAGGILNGGTFTARNTILATNTGQDLSGNLTSLGHNLIGNTHGGSGFRPDLGDLLDIDPLLGPLQDNGGPTQTTALLPASPALDAGDNAGTALFDQRGPGFSRILGGIIDIGAVEGG